MNALTTLRDPGHPWPNRLTMLLRGAMPPGPVARHLLICALALLAAAAQASVGWTQIAGSGGSPIVHSDLARNLVEAGFVVALPEHRGDNWHDMSMVGPKRWKLRPVEVSHAIDAVRAACTSCELAAELLGDAPGFDRSQVPLADAQIVQFFRQHLLP